jgi:3-oxoacyl-[acyl-carrier protein] reductase
MPDSLFEKVVLIGGASGGIGGAISRKFLQEGCKVALVGRNGEKLSKLGETLSSEFGTTNICSLVADCNRESEINSAVKSIISQWSRLDVVVANIGDGQSESDAIPSHDSFTNALQINLRIAENIARATQAELNRSRGSLLFISSIAGLQVTGAPTDYSVAKAALVMLSKQLSHKFAPNIRVNCIAPGNIYFPGGRWEELLKSDPVTTETMLKTKVPLNRFGTPEEVANAVLFLSSDSASFITGSCLTVDGGQTSAF